MPLSADYSTTKPVRAEDLQEIIDAVDDLLAPGWDSYTPAWSSDGTQPTIVDGTIVGASRKPASADLMDVRFKFTRGSSDTNGTGAYFFSIPAAAAGEIGTVIGTWYMLDAGTQHYSGSILLQTATTVLLIRDVGTVAAGAPITLATGDVISGRLSYQPA